MIEKRRVNPLQGMYFNYEEIIKGTEIKYMYLAIKDETLESRKEVDGYTDAYYKKDEFENYSYDKEEYNQIGITDNSVIRGYIQDKRTVPPNIQELLLEKKRESIINSYIEYNDYYRMLNGLPNINDRDVIVLDSETCTKYNISPTTRVHDIRKIYGDNILNQLEEEGVFDKLFSDNPDKKYIRFIGKRRVDILTVRRAKNFELIYLSNDIPTEIRDRFTVIYNQCRDYVMDRLYIYEYTKIIDYYDRFMAMCIMVMTLQQLTVKIVQKTIDREFLDLYQVQCLYETYDIPFYRLIDNKTQKDICKNINNLIRNKGTNKVIVDIAKLLGFTNINIYKYFLFKEHKLDIDGNPIFKKKTVFNQNTGKEEEVYDVKAMYDIYFQKIEVGNYDFYEALDERSNKVHYDSIVTGDKYWIEDSQLINNLYNEDYNYKESKYLGLALSYRLTDIMYEFILMMRLFFSNKDEVNKIKIRVPMVNPGAEYGLFDIAVFLCALLSKKFDIKGEVVSRASQVLAVLKELEYEPSMHDGLNDSYGFNFDFFKSTVFNTKKDELYKVLTEKERLEFESYIGLLTITGTSNKEKITALNKIYTNIKNLSEFLLNMLSEVNHIEDYYVIRDFYQTCFYVKETAKYFSVDNSPNVAPTFIDYLHGANYELYDFVRKVDKVNIYTDIENVIAVLDELIPDIDKMYVINNSTAKIQDILIDFIRFFKSYTTDMVGLNITYTIDFKLDNLFRLFNEFHMIHKKLQYEEDLNISYSDSLHKTISTYHISNSIAFVDTVYKIDN
jgi:hypothetical protein|uniref:Uncharacterized protein n=1 Tax=Myoviridae sp. ctXXl13 TaxID=2827691 RepID=A0A8S5TKE2_9CAUD|nr:MAG TPA: hypothetical protein [Myoviridae sp. ctXXl13]